MTPATILASLLGVSVLMGAALGVGYFNQRDQATQATAQRDAAVGAAKACSDAVDDLRTLAEKRKIEANTARAAAAKSATTHNRRADITLDRQPQDPANSCASLQVLGDEWLQRRNQP